MAKKDQSFSIKDKLGKPTPGYKPLYKESNSDFKDQYNHPMWQKTRLEVMQRDNWQCAICGNTERQLHVHHLKYIPGRKVWDVGNNNLITLCYIHHEFVHSIGDIPFIRDYCNEVGITTFQFLTLVIKAGKILKGSNKDVFKNLIQYIDDRMD